MPRNFLPPSRLAIQRGVAATVLIIATALGVTGCTFSNVYDDSRALAVEAVRDGVRAVAHCLDRIVVTSPEDLSACMGIELLDRTEESITAEFIPQRDPGSWAVAVTEGGDSTVVDITTISTARSVEGISSALSTAAACWSIPLLATGVGAVADVPCRESVLSSSPGYTLTLVEPLKVAE